MQSASCTAVASTTKPGAGEGKEGGCSNSEIRGAVDVVASGEQATSALGRNDEEGDSAAGAGSGEVLQAVSARVSTGPFCRMVVATVAVRDPKVGGTIKVRNVFRSST